MDNKINLSDLTKVQSNKDAEVDVNPTIEHLQELKNQLKNNKTNLYDSEYYKYIDDEIITEVTSKVINEYEKVKEKLNLQD